MAEPRKAYYVEEATKGVTLWLVYAETGREARQTYWENGAALDSEAHPNGVRSVRRAPSEDRDA